MNQLKLYLILHRASRSRNIAKDHKNRQGKFSGEKSVSLTTCVSLLRGVRYLD